MKTFAISVAFALALSAQEQTPTPPRKAGSIQLSFSSGGFSVGGVYTGMHRFGVFGQFGGAQRKDSDLPPEADFYWVDYRKEEWKDKTYLFGGLAFRISPNVTIGAGYSYYKREMYIAGPSSATGLIFRKPAPDKKDTGPVGMIDFGAKRGFGANIFAAPGLVGGGVSFRF